MMQEEENTESDKSSAENIKKEFFGKVTAIPENMPDGYFFTTDIDSMPFISSVWGIERKLPFNRPPEFDEKLLFYHPKYNALFRGIRVESSIASIHIIKLFLYDIGELFWVDIDSHPNIFRIPTDFKYCEAHCKLCYTDKIPDIGLRKDEFIEEMLDKAHMLKFAIKKREQKLYSEINLSLECLTVDVEFENEKVESEAREEVKNAKQALYPVIELIEEISPPMQLTYADNPIMISNIPKKPYLPSRNSYVLVYPSTFVTSNLIFGQVQPIDREWDLERFPTAVKSAWETKAQMNDRRLEFKRLSEMPVKDQVVVASRLEIRHYKKEEEPFFYRYLVLDVFLGFCRLFSIDFGFFHKLHYKQLYELPVQFRDVPSTAFRIKVINERDVAQDLAICNNLAELSTKSSEIPKKTDSSTSTDVHQKSSKATLKKVLKPFGVGLVKQVSDLDLTVKIYDRQGGDVKNLMS